MRNEGRNDGEKRNEELEDSRSSRVCDGRRTWALAVSSLVARGSTSGGDVRNVAVWRLGNKG